MSRIGRKPILVPKGVNVTVRPDAVEVKGPKGTLTQRVPSGVVFAVDKGEPGPRG
jgi:large subunit ribosomal protein L6